MTARSTDTGRDRGVLHLVLGPDALTARDYEDVIEPAIAAAPDPHDLRLVVEFVDGLPDVELRAFLADARTGWRHRSGWSRIAIVGAGPVMDRMSGLFSALVPGELRTFDAAALDTAIDWAAATPRP